MDDFFSEFHGNTKFNFHGFPPSAMQQFQQILEAMKEFEIDQDNGENQQIFENKFNEFRQKSDQDLDQFYQTDQLKTLIKSISPDHLNKEKQQFKPPAQVKKFKQPDEDKIMDKIHGTFKEEIVPVKPRRAKVQKIPVNPHHFGGLPPYDIPTQDSKLFSRGWAKSVISIRNADGSTETRKVELSPDGQTKTTITRQDANGKSSTESFIGDGKSQIEVKSEKTQDLATNEYAERNLVTKDGYKIPCLF